MVHFIALIKWRDLPVMAYRETDRTRERKAEVRDSILRSAHYIVSTQGFKAASVSAVAREADVATGTVYKHFPSKSDLLAEVFRTATQREVDKVAEAIAKDNSSEVSLRTAIECFSKRAIEGRTLAWALIAEPIDPVIDQERLTYRQAYADLFEDLLRKGIRNGEFPDQSSSVSSAAIVGVISEALVGPLSPPTRREHHDAVKPSELNEALLIETICRFCLQAVTGKANSPIDSGK